MSPRTLKIMMALIGVGLVGTVWLNWPQGDFVFDARTAQEMEAMTGTPDDNYKLRVHLTGLRYANNELKPWTDLEEPARSLWAVLSFESAASYNGKVDDYRRQLSLDKDLPPFDAVVAAYRSLGAERLADWLERASHGAGGNQVPADLLAEGGAAWLACVHQQSGQIAGPKP